MKKDSFCASISGALQFDDVHEAFIKSKSTKYELQVCKLVIKAIPIKLNIEEL